MKAGIIFPHQLYKDHPALDVCDLIYIIEEPLLFGDSDYNLKFHKKKLVLHRASMKCYHKDLLKKNYNVIYIQYEDMKRRSFNAPELNEFQRQGIEEVHYCDTTDFLLEKRLNKFAKRSHIRLTKYPSKNFLTDEEFFHSNFHNSDTFLMAKFYSAQRQRLKILVDGEGKPDGGKWSFDSENRKRLPAGMNIPDIPDAGSNEFITEAQDYVDKHFPDNPGSTAGFNYPVDHDSALLWLRDFLEKRFTHFGDYEDFVSKDHTFLFHSVLTPALNIGLISPQQIIAEALACAKKANINFNSLEGFLRQLIGWREFIRLIYLTNGVKQRTSNFWNFTGKMPASFYDASTGILPVDNTIRRVMEFGYCHHIERLMILGNFMLLCEISPNEVYRWFMEMFIDSYDWVMVPNVYGMSQFADGGLMSTKPYISSSNYVRKMSDYKSDKWCEVWDGLYWRFVFRNIDYFRSNHRLSMAARLMDRMDKQKLNHHIFIAENFLGSLK